MPIVRPRLHEGKVHVTDVTVGRISVWWRVVGCVPEFIKAAAHDGRSDGQRVLCAWTAPRHARPPKALLDLPGGTLDRAAADGPFPLSHLHVAHSVLVVLEAPSLPVEQVRPLPQLLGYGRCLPLIQPVLAPAQPAPGLRRPLPMQQPGRHPKCFTAWYQPTS